MATYKFTRATKEKAKLRMAIFGVAGSGKTYTGMRVATGMGGRIAVIDTERGSALKYADLFEFDCLQLDNPKIEYYIGAMAEAQRREYEVVIIDSLSHGWRELLHEVDILARRKYSGNRWSAWSEGTPKQQDFINALMDYDGHVIATMRSRTEWTTQINDKGKVEPVRIGTQPDQGKGIEYEFDVLIRMDMAHSATIEKSRISVLPDEKEIWKPGEDLGEKLISWLSQGNKPEKQVRLAEDAGKQPENGTWKELFDGVGNNPKRPIPAEHLKEQIRLWSLKSEGLVAHPKHRQSLADNLMMLFNENKDEVRDFLAEYTGHKAVSELPEATVMALLKEWMECSAWGAFPGADCQSEVQRVKVSL